MKNSTIGTTLFQLSLFFILPLVKFICLRWNDIVSEDNRFLKQFFNFENAINSFPSSDQKRNSPFCNPDGTLIFFRNYRL